MDQSSEAIEIEASIEARRKLIESECSGGKVDLTAAGLDDLDSLTVAICLYQKDSPINSLYLGTNSISDEGLEAISNSLSKHPELQHLYLGSNLFRDLGFAALANILPELKNLKTLSLGGAQLTDSACTSLATSLMAMEESALKYLFLNGNCIGDEGLLSLVVALSSDKFFLETLHLGDNKFTEVGLKLLSEWLESSTSLEKLFLNDNEMGQEGLASISESLVCNKNLKFLSIAACGIIDETFKPLLASLSVNESLESLHIWGNYLTSNSAELLIEVLRKHNHVLTDLQMFSNPIEDYESLKLELDLILQKNKLETIENPGEEQEVLKVAKETGINN